MQARKRIEYLKAKHIEERMLAYPSSQYGLEEDPTEQPGMPPQLPPSFSSDNNSHLYRSYEPKPGQPGWLTRWGLSSTGNHLSVSDGDILVTSYCSKNLSLRLESKEIEDFFPMSKLVCILSTSVTLLEDMRLLASFASQV